jgi:hypothetical protein
VVAVESNSSSGRAGITAGAAVGVDDESRHNFLNEPHTA